MNQKITFPELVSAISEATGYSKHLSEEFLKELFALIASTLASGENVKIKKIGTFKIVTVESRKSINVSTGEEIEIPEHKKVSFSPDKELADAINLPFAAFDTIELKDSVTDEMLLSSESNEISEDNATSSAINGPLPLTDWDNDDEEIAEQNDVTKEINNRPVDDLDLSNDNSNQIDEETDNQKVTISDENNYPESNDLHESNDDSDKKSNQIDDSAQNNVISDNCVEDIDRPSQLNKRKGFIPGFIWGVVAAVVIFAVTIGAILYLNPNIITQNNNNSIANNSNQSQIKPTTAIIDSTQLISSSDNQIDTTKKVHTIIPQTKPSDEVVYDTISLTRFLTTMAREHYGNYHLWPYIYEENSDILGHPDRIRPGTRVVIPAKSKYNIDPNNPECIEIAKKKGIEIYNRYKKH